MECACGRGARGALFPRPPRPWMFRQLAEGQGQPARSCPQGCLTMRGARAARPDRSTCPTWLLLVRGSAGGGTTASPRERRPWIRPSPHPLDAIADAQAPAFPPLARARLQGGWVGTISVGVVLVENWFSRGTTPSGIECGVGGLAALARSTPPTLIHNRVSGTREAGRSRTRSGPPDSLAIRSLRSSLLVSPDGPRHSARTRDAAPA